MQATCTFRDKTHIFSPIRPIKKPFSPPLWFSALPNVLDYEPFLTLNTCVMEEESIKVWDSAGEGGEGRLLHMASGPQITSPTAALHLIHMASEPHFLSPKYFLYV